eukprot:COSAG01_NODE_28826_length_652_cov_0.511754_1_plen_29_part_01
MVTDLSWSRPQGLLVADGELLNRAELRDQ